MNILVDATNIILGGGLSHLQEIFNSIDETLLIKKGIRKIYIVSTSNTLLKICNKPYIIKISMGNYSGSLLKRQIWKLFNFNRIKNKYNIDIVYNPGGGYLSSKGGYVTMCRNMLVFESEESKRFGFSLQRVRFFLLKILQKKSMENANGVIFISQYAKDYVKNKSKVKTRKDTIVYHGVSSRFSDCVKLQKPLINYSKDNPYKILYVSRIDVYKHQDKIAKAIVNISEKHHYAIEFMVVGDKVRGFKEFDKISKDFPSIVKHFSNIPFEEIQNIYKESDMFVFGSSCENMPNILIEAMSTGLPIACSNKGPMPEFLKDGGLFFDPEDVNHIEEVILEMLESPKLRYDLAQKSKSYTKNYNWYNCAEETLNFILECSHD